MWMRLLSRSVYLFVLLLFIGAIAELRPDTAIRSTYFWGSTVVLFWMTVGYYEYCLRKADKARAAEMIAWFGGK